MLKEKEKASELSEKTLTTAEAELQKQPDSEPIKETIKLYQQQAEEQKYLEIARVASAKSDEGKKNAQAQLQLAKKELEKAEAKVKELSRKHLAYHLAEELDAGEPCPVCLRPLDSIPEHAVPDDLADAERAVDEAIARKDEAERLYKAAETRGITDTSKVQGLEERLDSLSKRLKGAKPLAELKVQLELIAAVAARVEQARKTANDSQRQEREANTQFRKGEERLKQAWSEFERTRDLVAGLQPPPANRDDLKLSWEKLVDWAREKEKKATQEVVRLTDEAQLIGDRITAKSGGLRRACAEADIEIENNESIRDEVVEAHARAEEELKQIEQSIEKRQVLMTKKDDANRKAKVSGALARHLSANAFERWLLQEAFEQLVIGGSRKLLELSSGDYSFNLDERLNFDIVDHRNADEVRSSRTLSGGETFLASLALALTLAEQVADLATDGAARLESIFLDEGFGSLDPDTLEMVASTIEELGAKGRIVGLITHVRELADRIPVQYQVRKGPKTASVERIVL
jgi:exonuclease SbcC